MIILPILVVTAVVALATGGSLGNVTSLHLRWRGFIIGGFLLQVIVFSPIWQDNPSLEPHTQIAYAVSLVALLAALAANYRIPGLALIGPGFLCNLIAVALNGGYMPASASAMAAAGLTPLAAGQTLQNSIGIGPGTNVAFLGDIFAIPRWFIFPNVFSVGDVLIGLGAIYLIFKALRPAPLRTDSASPA